MTEALEMWGRKGIYGSNHEGNFIYAKFIFIKGESLKYFSQGDDTLVSRCSKFHIML